MNALDPLNVAVIINVVGWTLAIFMIISSILLLKGNLRPHIATTIWMIFGAALIAYGVCVLSVAGMLREAYPEKRYFVGACIATSIGLIILVLTGLTKLRRKRK